MSRASDAILGALHIALGEKLLERIQSGEATAAEFNAAIAFLKNNDITATIASNPALEALARETIPDFSDEVWSGKAN